MTGVQTCALPIFSVRREAQERFNAELQRDLAASVWASGCRSWYVTADGSVRNNWSGFMLDYWKDTLRPDFEDFAAA